MAMKSVKSTDPRKRFVMTVLKLKSGGNKVTSIKESVTEHYFTGTCLKGNRSGYTNLGTFKVTAEELINHAMKVTREGEKEFNKIMQFYVDLVTNKDQTQV